MVSVDESLMALGSQFRELWGREPGPSRICADGWGSRRLTEWRIKGQVGSGQLVEGFLGYVEDLVMDSMGACRGWG